MTDASQDGPFPDGALGIQPPSQLLRVVIVDDHEVLRRGTRQVLETAEDIKVVGEADDGATAVVLIEALEPDIVLLDIRLPDVDGIELSKKISAEHPQTKVVILSGFDDDDYLRAALSAGVTGYLLKSMAGAELIASVRAAQLGTIVLDPALAARLSRAPSRLASFDKSKHLTMRERQVVKLVSDGLANKAIAKRLDVSVRTVEGHLNHVFAKLDVTSRTELVRYALAHDLAQYGTDSGN